MELFIRRLLAELILAVWMGINSGELFAHDDDYFREKQVFASHRLKNSPSFKKHPFEFSDPEKRPLFSYLDAGKFLASNPPPMTSTSNISRSEEYTGAFRTSSGLTIEGLYNSSKHSPVHSITPSVNSVALDWVAHYGSGLAPSIDGAADMTIDEEGNIYVTGWSDSLGQSYDYLTIKYSSEGRRVWIARYNGTTNREDIPTAIAVDRWGNVFVTGFSVISGTNCDYATVKYNSEGVQQWVATYDGSANDDDEATAIAVDKEGNVCVTGFSVGTGTWYDYATIKYTPQGEMKWVMRYNGNGNWADIPTGLTIDCLSKAGYCYVTGYSTGCGTSYDYTTIQYNPDGRIGWVEHYNGADNGEDIATAIAVDPKGCLYVTGYSYALHSALDYVTIKYHPSGDQEWNQRYNGKGNDDDIATAIVTDRAGDVYLTGYSINRKRTYDYLTIKYNSSGRYLWEALYQANDHNSAYAIDLEVDGGGNVYVTGKAGININTVKYDSDGHKLWNNLYNCSGNSENYVSSLSLDNSGNIYVTGYGFSICNSWDYLTLKYDQDGERIWVDQFEGTKSHWDFATKLVIDQDENVYVTSSSYISGSYWDYLTVKYNSEGVEQWTARYDGPANSDDIATAISIDEKGNIYITGYSEGTGTSRDYATIKYDQHGRELWVARFNSPENSVDEATAIRVDPNGNVYITGYSYSSKTSFDYITVMYDEKGIEQWTSSYNGPKNSFDWAIDLEIDNEGNIYVTGHSEGVGSGYDYATVKYNFRGKEQWIVRYNGTGNYWDWVTDLAVDHEGNAHVTGYSSGSSFNKDYATIKYRADGDEQWVSRYNGPGNNNDCARALAIDAEGNVYVTGNSYGRFTSVDYATVKYDADGIEQWVSRYNGPVGGFNIPNALTIDQNSNVYVTGWSYNTGSFIDFATVKYTGDGDQEWIARYSDGKRTQNYATSLALDRDDNVVVTGHSGGKGWNKYTTVKYRQKAPNLEAFQLSNSTVPSLSRQYPNPFNPSTTIEFELPKAGFVTLTIYNVAGEKVTTLVSENLAAGSYQYRWDARDLASGVYFYRMQAGNFVVTRKIVMVK